MQFDVTKLFFLNFHSPFTFSNKELKYKTHKNLKRSLFSAYVATRFPMVEISRIKQVLAYKCKENSAALKMKAIRYYE